MKGRFLFAWRHAIASAEGPERAPDRLVAFVLSLYMDRDGLSAWPSQDTIAMRTGLTDRTVGRSLERLCAERWLSRLPRKSPKGKRHRRYGYEYRARLPDTLAEAYAKGERASLFKGQVNGERHDISMANAVRTNTPVELFTKGLLSRKKDLPPHRPATAAAAEVQRRRAEQDAFVSAYEAEERRAA